MRFRDWFVAGVIFAGIVAGAYAAGALVPLP